MPPTESQASYGLSQNVSEMTPEQREEFFAQIGYASPQIHPDGFEFFAFVVDGKVAVVFIASKETMHREIAAWSSNPTIVKLNNEQRLTVLENWNYDSQTGEFSEPE